MRNQYENRPSRRICVRRAFTLIEVLVAITIIALLLALTLPAVHSARVAARNTQCRNHLRQLGVAMADHEAAHQRYPANGWGYRWVGDPDRGTDQRQPGGWIYNLLDHLEQSPLRRTGSGLASRPKEAALSELMATPLEVFRCPSRPGRDLMLANIDVVPFNANWIPLVAKTDYAVNEGDVITDTRAGPRTLEEGDSGDDVIDGQALRIAPAASDTALRHEFTLQSVPFADAPATREVTFSIYCGDESWTLVLPVLVYHAAGAAPEVAAR